MVTTLEINPIKEQQESTFKNPGLANLLEWHRGEKHAIVLQDYPDPDAISSAFMHRLISARFDISVDILYGGMISHQQNLALVKWLNLEAIKFDPAKDVVQYDAAVLIDNQGTTAKDLVKALAAAGVRLLAVIDHHDVQNMIQAEFSDVRKVGATATIYTQYIREGLFDLDRSNKQHVLAATALMHGIMTDTGNFIQAKEDDFEAASFLSQYADSQALKEIMSQSRSKQTMDVIQSAIANRTIVQNYSIAGVGYIRAEDRDAIPQAADLLLTEDNVHTALVYGIVIDENQAENLVGSFRTTKFTLDADKFIKEVFGKTQGGEYFGGGKDFSGGFMIPVGFLTGTFSKDYLDLKWQLFSQHVRHLLLEKIDVRSVKTEDSPA